MERDRSTLSTGGVVVTITSPEPVLLWRGRRLECGHLVARGGKAYKDRCVPCERRRWRALFSALAARNQGIRGHGP